MGTAWYTRGMTIDALIMLAGAFVAALPFLGFPNSWDRFFLLAAGIFIIALGIVVRRRWGGNPQSPKNAEVRSPSVPRHEDQLAQ